MISHCLQYKNPFFLLRHPRPSWSRLSFPVQLNSSPLTFPTPGTLPSRPGKTSCFLRLLCFCTPVLLLSLIPLLLQVHLRSSVPLVWLDRPTYVLPSLAFKKSPVISINNHYLLSIYDRADTVIGVVFIFLLLITEKFMWYILLSLFSRK